jgi:hypothetical protein
VDSFLVQGAIMGPLFFGGLAFAAFMNYANLTYNIPIGILLAAIAASLLIAGFFAKRRGLRYLDDIDYWSKNFD